MSGTVNQFVYDANGNVVADSVKHNYYVKYDWRNLIVELRHWRYAPGGEGGPGGDSIIVDNGDFIGYLARLWHR